mmetsp:Transcript_3837/g.8993  ORF Transcript_3837/g.8993 Transcript_3837/m.8993 type:complete len:220 (-) Transcript_3837:345-1004(-)|eukprot:CAMPEP_0206473594 /NCGR_PEP_ID=MMETSP0324_2-20121206/32970_1 /ASSEMBLY_ACC=CAM_ASM_000836 /TAXON_ID=2866 /ORGANISM="Crypthecodinium cohnii, Strain Seligo" /LENGTH=219 /DNA_ID=CAMNT_0053948577 /DNA_START=146 /DNA_END=805 /DNA_ORIENTATION=-
MVTFAIKNTFVHVEESGDEENCAGLANGVQQPPCKTAPGDVLPGSFHVRKEQEVSSTRAWAKRLPRLMHHHRSAGSSDHDSEREQQAVEQAVDQCCCEGAGSQSSSLSSPTPSDQARSALSSIGAEGHRIGQCIPCLMQVRWMVGKCREPCRFGSNCGRCHEPHTEEELQKIQAKMRREKKRHGAAAAALLSAAFAQGKAAPIGSGASQMTLAKQQNVV